MTTMADPVPPLEFERSRATPADRCGYCAARAYVTADQRGQYAILGRLGLYDSTTLSDETIEQIETFIAAVAYAAQGRVLPCRHGGARSAPAPGPRQGAIGAPATAGWADGSARTQGSS